MKRSPKAFLCLIFPALPHPSTQHTLKSSHQELETLTIYILQLHTESTNYLQWCFFFRLSYINQDLFKKLPYK